MNFSVGGGPPGNKIGFGGVSQSKSGHMVYIVYTIHSLPRIQFPFLSMSRRSDSVLKKGKPDEVC